MDGLLAIEGFIDGKKWKQKNFDDNFLVALSRQSTSLNFFDYSHNPQHSTVSLIST